MLGILKPITGIIFDIKYKYYNKRKSRNQFFWIHEEPNMNLVCEPFNTRKTFMAHFINDKMNRKYSFLVKNQVPKIQSTIETLHSNIMNNIAISDNLQTFLEINPQRNDITREYEKHIHDVKEDMSTLRKLESFLIRYRPDYIRKPTYAGEERDNVNTYI